jgi:hypothetical protein
LKNILDVNVSSTIDPADFGANIDQVAVATIG